MLSLLYEGEWKVTLAMRKQRAPAVSRNASAIEIVIESPLWKQHRGAKALLRRAIAQAAAMVPPTVGELAIVLTDDAAIRTLNRDFLTPSVAGGAAFIDGARILIPDVDASNGVIHVIDHVLVPGT